MIEEFDGLFIPPDNLHNLGALGYILDAIKSHVYGYSLYSSLKEKANAIAYQIISRHVFHDGNKRTAVHIAWEFLHSNGIPLFLDSSIIELTEAIAAGESSREELLNWLHEHQSTSTI